MAKIPINPVTKYPDVSDLLKAKNEQRLIYANRSFAEKSKVAARLRDVARMWRKSHSAEKNNHLILLRQALCQPERI